jgi:predicted nucleic acid-binding protein
MGIEILPLPADFLIASQEFRQVHGLPVNDSLIALHMRSAGVALLASADAAFDRVPWIRRFVPSDV